MSKGRLEAFSDGVIAVIITIMVLELKVPRGANIADLLPVLPVLLTYVVSFVFIGIYWNNHHHMLHAVRTVNGSILWANLHLLFWLSLVPFVTAWAGQNYRAARPVALYGGVLLMCGVAYYFLERALIAHEGADSSLARALGKDVKGKTSLGIYVIAILASFINPWISIVLYVIVALIWFVPDRRIEKMLAE
ncbi:MAG: TMEM175 family protein [Candidatus Acidiferrales bacterium]